MVAVCICQLIMQQGAPAVTSAGNNHSHIHLCSIPSMYYIYGDCKNRQHLGRAVNTQRVHAHAGWGGVRYQSVLIRVCVVVLSFSRIGEAQVLAHSCLCICCFNDLHDIDSSERRRWQWYEQLRSLTDLHRLHESAMKPYLQADHACIFLSATPY